MQVVRKLKIVFPALVLIVSFACLLPVTSCKKTYTTVIQDSVFHSSWVALDMKMQVDNQNDTFYAQEFTNSKITAKVISGGVILGYLGYPGNGSDTIVLPLAEQTAFSSLQQIISPGTIDLVGYADYSYTTTSGYLYRYVIIPGNVLANSSLSGLTQQQLNKMSFTEINNALKTPAQGTSTGQGNTLH
jgi:hypothetical protein